MRGKLKKTLKCESGTQMIEFALLLPFLIVLFASAVEMGRMFYTYTTLQKSTEVGARYLSSKPLTSGAFAGGDINTAKNLVVCGIASNAADGCSGQPPIASNLTTGNVSITQSTILGNQYVTVTVTYVYQPLVFDLGHMTGVSQLSLNFTFTPAITMRYML